LVLVTLGSGLDAVLVAMTGRWQFPIKAVTPHDLKWLFA